MPVRTYDNTLRRHQAEDTRRRILEAVCELLVESPASVQIPEIAARAGVSEPTVYRHFPNRDALLAAAAAFVSASMGAPPAPPAAEDLPATSMAVAAYFERNARWIRAALAEPLLRPLRQAGRQRRLDERRRLLAPAVAHLSPDDRRVALAAIGAVARADTWDCLTRELGLSSEEAGRATAWVLQSLLDALARGRRQNRAALVDDRTIAKGRAIDEAARTSGRPS